MTSKQGAKPWACPACGAGNPPGSDSCQVCGAHLHVPESTGRVSDRPRSDPTHITWALGGFATPLLGMVLGTTLQPTVGTAGAIVVFVLVQVLALLPRQTRSRPAFLVGWVLGLALAAWSVFRGAPGT